MPISIGSNIGSLQAQRRLGEATSSVSDLSQKLSSGLRINKASDDAAGLSVSQTLNAKGRILGQAIKNINDGISVLSIIDQTLSAQQEIIVRLKELAEQSANGTYSSDQRLALNREYAALVSESGRIADSTSFNGISLMASSQDGTPSQIVLQAGGDSSSGSQISVSLMNTGSFSGTLGLKADLNNSNLITVVDQQLLKNSSINTLDDAQSTLSGAIYYMSAIDSTGVKRDLWIGFAPSMTDNLLKANPAAINLNRLDFVVRESLNGAGVNVAYTNNTWLVNGLSRTVTLAASGAGDVSLSIDLRGLNIQSLDWNQSVTKTALEFTGVETVNRATDAITTLASRSDELSLFQGQIGASMSRLESALAVTRSSQDATATASSTISDVDVAQNSALLLKQQVLQKVATSVLAQANLQPKIALKLLSDL